TAFQYDRLGRLTFAGYGRTGSVNSPSYESSISYDVYDKASRLMKVTDSIAGVILRGYDDFDSLLCESNGATTPCTTSQPNAVTYSYDSAGRRQGVFASGQAVACYRYDDASRPTNLNPGPCSDPATLFITYDYAGRRNNITFPNSVLLQYGYGP